MSAKVRGDEAEVRRLAREARVQVLEMTHVSGYFRPIYDLRVEGNPGQLMAFGKALELAEGKRMGSFALADILEQSTMRPMSTDKLTDPGIGGAVSMHPSRAAIARSLEGVQGVGRGSRIDKKPLSVDEVRAGIDAQLGAIISGTWQMAWGEAFSGGSDEKIEPGFSLSETARAAYEKSKGAMGKVFARSIDIGGHHLEIVLPRTLSKTRDLMLQVFEGGELSVAGRVVLAEAGNKAPACMDWNARLPRKVEEVLDERARILMEELLRTKNSNDADVEQDPAVCEALEGTYGAERPVFGGGSERWPLQSLRQLVFTSLARTGSPAIEEELDAIAGEGGQISAEALAQWVTAQGTPRAGGPFGTNLVHSIAVRSVPDWL